MSKLYLSRENEDISPLNINTVLTTAIKNNHILRMGDKGIHKWFKNLHKSTQELLFKSCKELDIEIVF